MIRFAGVGLQKEAKSGSDSNERNEAEARVVYESALHESVRSPSLAISLFHRALDLVSSLPESDNCHRLQYLAQCNMGRAHERNEEYDDALACFVEVRF